MWIYVIPVNSVNYYHTTISPTKNYSNYRVRATLVYYCDEKLVSTFRYEKSIIRTSIFL